MNTLELKIPPAALSFIFAAAMWLSSAWMPSLSLNIPWRITFAFVPGLFGLAIAGAGILAFQRVDTTINPITPDSATTLVTSGVYKISRNPMYVGVLFILAGCAVFLAHVLPFLYLPLFVLYMNRFQIVPEERAMLARFGNEYSSYRQAVRRWL